MKAHERRPASAVFLSPLTEGEQEDASPSQLASLLAQPSQASVLSAGGPSPSAASRSSHSLTLDQRLNDPTSTTLHHTESELYPLGPQGRFEQLLAVQSSAPELESEPAVADVALPTFLMPAAPPPPTEPFERPMEDVLLLDDERVASVPSRSDFGPQWQLVLSASALEDSALRSVPDSDASGGSVVPLGFAIEVPVDDVETLLLLLQTHHSPTFLYAAELLTRWLSRSTCDSLSSVLFVFMTFCLAHRLGAFASVS